MKRFLIAAAAILAATGAYAVDTYEIEVAADDELFIINGERFESKTYCLGWEEGEDVIFIDGSANGVCLSAELYNLNRRESCEVWCE
jgi:hypothetical protein